MDSEPAKTGLSQKRARNEIKEENEISKWIGSESFQLGNPGRRVPRGGANRGKRSGFSWVLFSSESSAAELEAGWLAEKDGILGGESGFCLVVVWIGLGTDWGVVATPLWSGAS